MSRVGPKYPVLFELSLASPEDTSFAGRVLRAFASSSWSDASFLDELAESGLIGTICRVLPVLKAKAARRSASNSLQDLADLEEAVRKLRHELGIAEKRLPSSGGGSSSQYPSWSCVGRVCVLMLQALTHSATAAAAVAAIDQGGPAATSRDSSPPGDAAAARSTPARAPEPAGPNVSAAAQQTGDGAPPNTDAARAALEAAGAAGAAAAAGQGRAGDGVPEGGARASPTPASSAAAAAAVAAGAGTSGSSTPTRGTGTAAAGRAGGSATATPGATGYGTTPVLATETGLIRLLSNKHVVSHAKEVLRAVPEHFKAALVKLVVTQISTELRATLGGLTHILQIIKGDPAVTSPAPTTLPKAWLTTAVLLSAYSEALKSSPSQKAKPLLCSDSAARPSGAEGGDAAASKQQGVEALAGALPSTDRSPDGGEAAANAAQSSAEPAPDANGDVEMADAERQEARTSGAAPVSEAGASRAAAAAAAPSDACADGAVAAAAGAAAAAAVSGSAASAAESAGGDDAGTGAEPDPRVELTQLLEDVAAALREAVLGAHGVSRMALLLRGEAAAKFNSASAFMPTALSVNDLMSHLDALACVGAALGPAATDRLRPGIACLLQSAAVKELLGAGKVYVTTVIAAGALARDLAIDAVIPQSLRNGYMAAVLTPLETGALLNERRAPQVLAYRNSITESSYYQVMDADALPYGVNVRFEDEQEAEGMGVVREWLSQIAADIFAPDRGLFVRGAADRRVVHPSPLSAAQEDCMGYMCFAGRIVGLALRANVPLGVVLSTGLYKYLTGRQAGLQDLEQIDPQVYTTCQNILANPGAEALELYHVWHTRPNSSDAAPQPSSAAAAGSGASVSAAGARTSTAAAAGPSGQQPSGSGSGSGAGPAFGAGSGAAAGSGSQGASGAGAGSGADTSAGASAGTSGAIEVEVELLPGGSKLRVTDGNKAAYVELLAQHLVVGAVEEQCASFLRGLQDTAAHLPEEARLRRAFLAPLQLDDLNRITAGESSLDVDEWAVHTDVAGFDSEEEQDCLDMFWELVSEYSAEDRQRLLQFWTAMTHLPSGGFKALNQRLQIMKLGPPAGRQAVAGDAAAAAPGPGPAAPAGGAGPASASPAREHAAAAAAAAAAAPEPAADGRGPSAGGAGPRSHQIDGDGFDGEEQEPDNGAEQDGGGQPAEGRGPAPAAEGAEPARGQPAPPEGGNAAAAGPGAAAAAGDAGGRAPSSAPSATGGDAGETPYAEDEYEEGGGEGEGDGMDYGDDEEGEDEEFQRQLAMALALSLQDMPPGEQPPEGGNEQPAEGAAGGGDAGPSSGGASGSGGEESGAGPAGGGGTGGSGAGGAAGEVAEQGAAAPVETEAEAAAEGDGLRAEGGDRTEQPSPSSNGATAGADGGNEGASDAGRPAGAAAAPSGGGAVAGPSGPAGPATAEIAAAAAAADADGDHKMGLDQSASAVAADSEAAAPEEPANVQEPAAGAGDAAAAAAAGDRAAVPAAAGEGPHTDAGGLASSAPPADTGNGAPALHDMMDTDVTEEGGEAAPGQPHTAPGEGAPQGAAEQAPPPPQPPSELDMAPEQAPEPAANPDAPNREEQPEAPQQDAGAASMDVEAAGTAPAAPEPEAVAAAAPLAVRPAAPLPQARTCFLQLNLPVYESLDDMRRAFNIALDNMSFGLH